MQKVLAGDLNGHEGKKFYKAKRDLVLSPNLPTQTKNFSPDGTPSFSQSSESTQGIDLEIKETKIKTPSTVTKSGLQVSGKRGQLPEGIKVLKYFKNSENTLIEKKSLTLTDSSGKTEIFSVHEEETYLNNAKILHLDQDVDDYDTTITEMRMCKDMLEQQLKEAFSEIGIDNN